MHTHLVIVEDIIDHWIIGYTRPRRSSQIGNPGLARRCSSSVLLFAPNSLPLILSPIRLSISYSASLLSNWSLLPRHCQSVVYFPAPVFRRLQVVGRRESWMSAHHPPTLPPPHFRHPSSAIFFPLSSVLHRYIRGRGHWHLGIEHWLKRLEDWDIGDGFAVSAWTRAQERLRWCRVGGFALIGS